MLNPKNRIINFRVTDDELARLKSASDLRGSRCLSDFARTIMLRAAESPAVKENARHIDEKIHSLTRRLEIVESDLLHVLNAIKMLRCSGDSCRKQQD